MPWEGTKPAWSCRELDGDNSGTKPYKVCEFCDKDVCNKCTYTRFGAWRRVQKDCQKVKKDVERAELTENGHEATESCGEQHAVRSKVDANNFGQSDLAAYLGCLKGGGRDMSSEMVMWVTSTALQRGQADSSSKECEELVAKDGCNEDFSEKLSG